MSNLLKSRFFHTSDLKVEQLIFPLPQTWWSRFYEYAWASLFVEEEDIVLDAACGLSHPFKFYLPGRCKEVHACDMDERITSIKEIEYNIVHDFGEKALDLLPEKVLERIHFQQANLTRLPYHDQTFSKIFCISVLEHLQKNDMLLALQEFKRTLKEDGLIILTFDYPTIQIQELRSIIQQAGLSFAGEVSIDLPKDAVYSDLWGRLYCYRTVLCNP